MSRTSTTHLTTFERPRSVTYDLSTSGSTTITLPPASSWTSGLHWHATHTEYLSVLKGTALVTLNGITKTYTALDGIIVVPRYARHEWKRAPPSLSSRTKEKLQSQEEEEGDLMIREWTDPEDGQKEIFFRNLNSVINHEVALTNGKPRSWWLEWQILVICKACDNFPVFLDMDFLEEWGEIIAGGVGEGVGMRVGRWIEELVTGFILWIVAFVGGLMGLRGAYEDYTPRVLIEGKKSS